MTSHSKDAADRPVGLVVLDDPEGLAPRIADILRSAARRIGGRPRRGRSLQDRPGAWPQTTVATRQGATDGAGRPGRTRTTIRHGLFAAPQLHVSTQVVSAARLMWWDPADYLLALARLAEGGDGTPCPRDLRRVAVASALCDRDPAHARDMVMLHTATAFEPAFLYDEGPRYANRLESRILRAGEGLSDMIEALPRVTRVTTSRSHRRVPSIAIAPFADRADDPISEADLELVGCRHPMAVATSSD